MDLEPPASQTGSYLMPLLIVPLLKVNGTRSEGLDGTAFFVQQLDVDLILTATVPAWRVPEEKCLQSPRRARPSALTVAFPRGTYQSDTLMSGWKSSMKCGL